MLQKATLTLTTEPAGKPAQDDTDSFTAEVESQVKRLPGASPADGASNTVVTIEGAWQRSRCRITSLQCLEDSQDPPTWSYHQKRTIYEWALSSGKCDAISRYYLCPYHPWQPSFGWDHRPSCSATGPTVAERPAMVLT